MRKVGNEKSVLEFSAGSDSSYIQIMNTNGLRKARLFTQKDGNSILQLFGTADGVQEVLGIDMGTGGGGGTIGVYGPSIAIDPASKIAKNDQYELVLMTTDRNWGAVPFLIVRDPQNISNYKIYKEK